MGEFLPDYTVHIPKDGTSYLPQWESQTSHIIRTSEEIEWKILGNKRQKVTDSWIKLHTVIGKSIPLKLPDFKTIGT